MPSQPSRCTPRRPPYPGTLLGEEHLAAEPHHHRPSESPTTGEDCKTFSFCELLSTTSFLRLHFQGHYGQGVGGSLRIIRHVLLLCASSQNLLTPLLPCQEFPISSPELLSPLLALPGSGEGYSGWLCTPELYPLYIVLPDLPNLLKGLHHDLEDNQSP